MFSIELSAPLRFFSSSSTVLFSQLRPFVKCWFEIKYNKDQVHDIDSKLSVTKLYWKQKQYLKICIFLNINKRANVYCLYRWPGPTNLHFSIHIHENVLVKTWSTNYFLKTFALINFWYEKTFQSISVFDICFFIKTNRFSYFLVICAFYNFNCIFAKFSKLYYYEIKTKKKFNSPVTATGNSNLKSRDF